MATDNDATAIQGVVNSKNLNYKEMIAEIDGLMDRLNARLSTDGTVGGADEDAATDAAVTAAKVQTAAISARVDVLFPYVQQS